MSYFMVILFILAIILLPFILLRNRRAGNNDVFLNDEEAQDRQPFNDSENQQKNITMIIKK